MMRQACAVVALLAVCGCATVTPAGYYWGHYSTTLYGYTKAPSDETLSAHVAELERIVSESNNRGLRVPPGIHAELGYLKARQGDNNFAMAQYEEEMRLYPESRLFLERLTATQGAGGN